MLLSQTSAYAIRAAIHLAERGDAGPVRVAEIATALDVPRNYLSKILHQLASEGVLESERGPRGGFRLAAAPDAIRLSEILTAVDSQRLDRRCLLGRAECSDADPCAVHDRWQRLADDISRFLTDTTLGELTRRKGRVARTRHGRLRRASAHSAR